MDGLLPKFLNIIVPVFSVLSMLSAGLAYTFHEIVKPLRNKKRGMLMIAADCLLVPVLTIFIIVTTLSFESKGPLVMVVILSLTSMAILFPLAWWHEKGKQEETTKPNISYGK
ncbi:hypothetical protein [Pontibacter roseus]|uniref:hypothetical protein n=1 Tax=Pontibacter roseus TaxID=336989 RepID=UPI0003741348|nr:hypothetical protein [Pontibacter roseus]